MNLIICKCGLAVDKSRTRFCPCCSYQLYYTSVKRTDEEKKARKEYFRKKYYEELERMK